MLVALASHPGYAANCLAKIQVLMDYGDWVAWQYTFNLNITAAGLAGALTNEADPGSAILHVTIANATGPKLQQQPH